ncbi:MAG: patatin-like phospholipase family protein [Dehalococcoidia bacterium]|nr:patatin-like phospholipase family protein [Dehalococcoidia bacterium]
MRFFRRRVPKIGLALGSGAARGLAHIGVLKALKEAEIPIDMVAGTSMGAMVGACFANDGDISAVEEIAINTGWRQLARLLDPKLSFLGKGLIRGQKIEILLHSLIGDVEFKDLKIPFAAVAADVNTGVEIVIRKGSVIQAVRASISIPGIFVPVTFEGRCLVDGGLVNPVPADVLGEMGAKFVIAVNVLVEPRKSRSAARPSGEDEAAEVPNIFNTLLQSLYIMEYEMMKTRMLKADILISPDISRLEAFEFHRGEEAILIGYQAARDALPKIRKLIGKR